MLGDDRLPDRIGVKQVKPRPRGDVGDNPLGDPIVNRPRAHADHLGEHFLFDQFRRNDSVRPSLCLFYDVHAIILVSTSRLAKAFPENRFFIGSGFQFSGGKMENHAFADSGVTNSR